MCSRVLLSSDGSPFVRGLGYQLRKLSIETDVCGWSAKNITEALEKKEYSLVCIVTIENIDEMRRLTEEILGKYPDIRVFLTVCMEHHHIMAPLRMSDRVRCSLLPQSHYRLAEQVRRILEEPIGSIYSFIADYMYFLGLRRKYDGFRYLCKAVELCIEDSSRLSSIVKGVYEKEGEIYGVSSAVIERSLRYLSKVAYEDGVIPKITGGITDRKLTNHELIRYVYEGFTIRRAM